MSRSWQGRRVAVTGAVGMTGSYLVEQLQAAGAIVRVVISPGSASGASWLKNAQVIEGDLRDPGTCAALVDGVDELLHLASRRLNVAGHHEQSGRIAVDNVAMTMALIGALKDHGPLPVTFFSTGNIPDSVNPLALQEQSTVDGYVIGKYACELLWLAAARERGYPLLIVRPVGIYGPRDWFSAQGNLIPALLVKARSGAEYLEVWGDGKQERSFLYVNDVVNALLCLLENEVTGVQFLSPPEVVSVGDLAARVRDLVAPGLPLRFDTGKEPGSRKLLRKQVHDCLADFRWTPIDDGLASTVRWWEAHRQDAA